jgi:4-amino-4-deoxy-L-arabinose transferase-like glycosyltransferase
MDRRRSRRLIVAAACAATILRLGFALLYWTDKPLTHDEREYLALAESLAAGRGFTYSAAGEAGSSPQFGRAPGYPAFLALLGVSGRSEVTPARVKVVQSILGGLAVLLLAALARIAAGDRSAAICAWMAAVYPPLVWMPAYTLSEALYLPLALLCALLLTVGAAEGPLRKRLPGRIHLDHSLTAGLIAGAGALVRPGLLVFIPAAALWLARRRQLASGIAFALAATLVIAPWTVRNLRHYGRFVLIASEGGVTFWTGNHPLARGEGDLAANPDLKRAELAFRAAHPDLTAEQLEPLYYREAIGHIRNDPGWWLTLEARKAFYTVVPIGPSYTLHSTKYLLATVVPYAALVPLAIAGLVMIQRSGRPPEPFYLLAASVVLTSLIFFPQERFRLPVIDPLVVLGAAAAIGGVRHQHP